MAVRNNSKVLVIIWSDNKVEVTQVTANDNQRIARERGAKAIIVPVQSNTPDSLR